MKRIIKTLRYALVLLFLFTGIEKSYSQYTIDKHKYDYKEYSYKESDKYHPAIAGVASYVIPGLGQIYCNENKRGYRFLAGYTTGILIMMTGTLIDLQYYMSPIEPNSKFTMGKGLIISGAMFSTGIQIWSAVDAVRVSKVKNMAFREKNNSQLSLTLKPTISVSAGGAFMLTAGITF